MITCPSCNGEKRMLCLVDRSDGTGGLEHVDCYTCRGKGEVDESMADRMAVGEKMRLERIARHETLFDAAKRLGMSPRELSDKEHGKE